ncbi:MAG: dihydroorotase [Ignavibacteriota bacterium]|nr:dihydroorotase [Ignavibacteriota bacterium]
MNLLLKNIGIISPKDNLKGIFDVFIKDGRIESIGSIDSDGNAQVIDCEGLTAVPGFFDMHVHFRDPGQTEKEDIDSGVLSAANGGFTGVLCMPNTKPPIDNKEVIEYINDKARGKIVDVVVSACASKYRAGDELADLNELYDAGAMALTDDGSPLLNEEVLRKTLEFTASHNVPFLQHAENYKVSGNGAMHKGKVSEQMNVEGIPYESETQTVRNDIAMANSITGSKYHVQHLSCGETVEILRKARKTNENITCEACPHHFVLTDEAVVKEGTNAKMNPPLREDEDVEKILLGLADGTIDVICTDHAPHTSEEKSRNIYDAPFGIVGLETCVGLTYKYLVETEVITFENMVEKMSDNPRRILNLPRISIVEGEKANLTILKRDEEWVVVTDKFKTKSRNTPFSGYKLKCKPYAVINNDKMHLSEL